MFAEERRKEILSLLTSERRVEVAALAQRFDVSEDTVRRDLRELATLGYLQKTHGGAVCLDTPRLGWEARVELMPRAKARIGEAAAALVEPGQTIILDAGLTVLEAAHQIRARPLTVITNSLDIAAALDAALGVSLVLTGGEWNPALRHLAGAAAIDTLARYRADWAFLGACAVHPQAGITVADSRDAAVKKAMMGAALRTLLLADHSKFDQVAPHFVASLTELQGLVTDQATDLFEASGVKVIVADQRYTLGASSSAS